MTYAMSSTPQSAPNGCSPSLVPVTSVTSRTGVPGARVRLARRSVSRYPGFGVDLIQRRWEPATAQTTFVPPVSMPAFIVPRPLLTLSWPERGRRCRRDLDFRTS